MKYLEESGHRKAIFHFGSVMAELQHLLDMQEAASSSWLRIFGRSGCVGILGSHKLQFNKMATRLALYPDDGTYKHDKISG